MNTKSVPYEQMLNLDPLGIDLIILIKAVFANSMGSPDMEPDLSTKIMNSLRIYSFIS